MLGTRNRDWMPWHLRWVVWAGLLLVAQACIAAGAHAQNASPQEQEEPGPASQLPLTLTEQVVRDVLQPFQSGIEEHNLNRVLGVFDAEQTPDFARLRDEMRGFFRLYEPVRFRYKLLQVASEKDEGFAVAEVDMAATRTDDTGFPVQRSTQMRFQMKLEAKGWKLVAFKPGDFFLQ